MIALPVLMIAAGAELRWAIGGAGSNTLLDAIGLILMAAGTLLLATFVVTGRWWKRREASIRDSSRV